MSGASLGLGTQLGQLHGQLNRLIAQHHQTLAEHERVLKAVSILLHSVADEAVCKGCPATIFWVRHRNGKSAPYNADGTNHFVTCPKSKLFKKTKETPTR
jgi:hypothetical protein